MIRGLFDVAVMMPNDAPELKVLLGFAKFDELVRSKTSARKCRLCDSTMGIVRSRAISMLRCPGPRTRPTPLLPKSVSADEVPFGASGAEANAAAFRYGLITRE